MVTNLIQHYKDKEPKETIQNIIEFFNSKNLVIKTLGSCHSEINTYSTRYGLFWQNHLILSANGKGMTEDYCQASGYAELYERFCGEVLSNNYCFLITHDLTEIRKKQYGYYYYPNEKEITLNDIFTIGYNKKFFYDCFDTETNIEKFINIFTNNHLSGYPYQSLLDDSIIYQNYNTFHWALGTTGLAAGNTLEEALVQGCSEMFERIAINKFFHELQDTYYIIDQQTLNAELQERLSLLKANGYEITLFDLSYNFNLPVCLIILYNPMYQMYYYNFGSSPIYDIAIERCITEIYQGFCSLPTDLKLIPYDNHNGDKYVNITYHGILSNNNEIVDMSFVFQNIKIKPINLNIFLNAQKYSNIELLEQIKFILRNNNYHFRWLNISQSNKIYAVHIIAEEYLIVYRSALHHFLTPLTSMQKTNFIDLIDFIYNNLIELKNKSQLQFNENNVANFINKLLEKCMHLFPDIFSCLPFINILLGYKLYDPYFLINKIAGIDYSDLFYLITKNYELINFNHRDTRQIIWEQNQNNLNQYSNIYLIYLLYIKNFYDIYTSDKYKEFLYMLNGEINTE